MNEPHEAKPSSSDLLRQVYRAAHPALALAAGAFMENALGDLLALTMPNLSKRLREKLFKGYGPLSSFSAKIDVAYALDLIPAQLRRDLHVVREIRNEFAHSTEIGHFDVPAVKALLQKFPDYRSQVDPVQFYVEKVIAIVNELKPIFSPLEMAKALKAGTSKEKSA